MGVGEAQRLRSLEAPGFFGRPIAADWRRQLDFTTKIFRARGLHPQRPPVAAEIDYKREQTVELRSLLRYKRDRAIRWNDFRRIHRRIHPVDIERPAA